MNLVLRLRRRLRDRLGSGAAALRPARPSDAAALAAILSDWIDATPWMPRIHSRAEDRGFVARLIAEMTVTVAERDGRAAGFLARRDGFVHALYLAPAERRRGTGRRLLRAAQADCAELVLWCFQANAPARAFYASEGFVAAEATDGAGNDEHLPDLRLVWHRAGAAALAQVAGALPAASVVEPMAPRGRPPEYFHQPETPGRVAERRRGDGRA